MDAVSWRFNDKPAKTDVSCGGEHTLEDSEAACRMNAPTHCWYRFWCIIMKE